MKSFNEVIVAGFLSLHVKTHCYINTWSLLLFEITGLTVEGIFRLSGAASEVDQLCRLFDTPPTYGKYLDLSSYDIHAIVGTLKKYLRSLPYPVIPTAYHEQFLGATNNIQRLAHLAMRQLPRAHYIMLYTIIELCSHIQAHSHVNMMNPEALAVVLAPVCTGLDQSLKDMFALKNKDIVTGIVQANARWTDLWTRMIQNHKELLDIWSIEQTRLPPVVVNVALPNKVAASNNRPSSSKPCGVIVMRKRGGQHYQRKHTSWPMERRTCLTNDDYCLMNPSYDILSVRRRTQSMVNPSIAPI